MSKRGEIYRAIKKATDELIIAQREMYKLPEEDLAWLEKKVVKLGELLNEEDVNTETKEIRPRQ